MKINFEVNNIKYSVIVEKGKNLTILQACEMHRIMIPRFCFHDKLTIAGNCRMCLVDVVDNQSMSWAKKPLAACTINIAEGLSIFTNTTLIKKAREGVLEFLLANHPLDCPVCDQAGECDLQDQNVVFGNESGRFYENKRYVNNKFVGPFIKMIMTRCIHCTRCVRFGNEIAGVSVLGVTGRGGNMEIGNYIKKMYKSEFSGSIIDLCPVGALTSKPYSFVARQWELRIFRSIIPLYSTVVEVRFELRGKKILRILPSINFESKNEWITDTMRFCYDGLKIQRLNIPLMRSYKTLKFFQISWDFSFFVISNFLFNLKFSIFNLNKDNLLIRNNLCFFLNRFVSIESLFVIKKFLFFFDNVKILLDRNIDFKFNDFLFLNFLDFDNLIEKNFSYDAFIFVGINLRFQLPLINVKIKKLLNKKLNFFVGIFYFVDALTYISHLLGNNLKNLNDMFLGKHQICQHLLKFKNVCFFFEGNFVNIFLKNEFFFFFSKIIFNFFRKIGDFSKKLKIILEKTVYYSLIYNNLSFLKNNFFKIKEEYNFSCLNFFLNTDDFLFLNSKRFYNKNLNVFIGTNGISDANYSDLILPVSNFIEAKYSYLNLNGIVYSTKVILNADMNVREEWKILFNFYYYYYYNFKFYGYQIFMSISKLFSISKLKLLTNEKFIFSEKINFMKIYFLNSLSFAGFFNINNIFSIKALESIYLFDTLTRSSNNLLMAYFDLEKNNSFLFLLVFIFFLFFFFLTFFKKLKRILCYLIGYLIGGTIALSIFAVYGFICAKLCQNYPTLYTLFVTFCQGVSNYISIKISVMPIDFYIRHFIEVTLNSMNNFLKFINQNHYNYNCNGALNCNQNNVKLLNNLYSKVDSIITTNSPSSSFKTDEFSSVKVNSSLIENNNWKENVLIASTVCGFVGILGAFFYLHPNKSDFFFPFNSKLFSNLVKSTEMFLFSNNVENNLTKKNVIKKDVIDLVLSDVTTKKDVIKKEGKKDIIDVVDDIVVNNVQKKDANFETNLYLSQNFSSIVSIVPKSVPLVTPIISPSYNFNNVISDFPISTEKVSSSVNLSINEVKSKYAVVAAASSSSSSPSAPPSALSNDISFLQKIVKSDEFAIRNKTYNSLFFLFMEKYTEDPNMYDTKKKRYFNIFRFFSENEKTFFDDARIFEIKNWYFNLLDFVFSVEYERMSKNKNFYVKIDDFFQKQCNYLFFFFLLEQYELWDLRNLDKNSEYKRNKVIYSSIIKYFDEQCNLELNQIHKQIRVFDFKTDPTQIDVFKLDSIEDDDKKKAIKAKIAGARIFFVQNTDSLFSRIIEYVEAAQEQENKKQKHDVIINKERKKK